MAPLPLQLCVQQQRQRTGSSYLAKAAAWTYLVASCIDKAYALIERCKGDPHMAWSILQEKYCATDAEENYPEVSEGRTPDEEPHDDSYV